MSTPPHLSVRAAFFARYAELLGTHQADLMIPVGGLVADVIRAVRSLPGGTSLPSRLLVARNLEQVGEDVPIADGDELAFLPPMSGG
jgi:molybdopterin converting factor small subunit